jgi:hypothetical protein
MSLRGLTAMQPVVVNPAITFIQLAREFVQVTSDEERPGTRPVHRQTSAGNTT